MWKIVKGRLIHVTDHSRVRYKTYISKKQLMELEALAASEDTHVSYLLENALQNLLLDNDFVFLKEHRLRDKVEFRTTCDKNTLENAKAFAKEHKLNFTDVIQASVNYIDLSEIKSKSWRHRIE